MNGTPLKAEVFPVVKGAATDAVSEVIAASRGFVAVLDKPGAEGSEELFEALKRLTKAAVRLESWVAPSTLKEEKPA